LWVQAILEGEEEMEPQLSLDERTWRVLRGQLGREPRGVLGIERHCRFGYPQVIKVYPLLRDGAGEARPFPTLFWLTCPALVEQLSRLEQQGYIKALEQALAEDERLRREYYEDHRRYIAERWAALSPEDRALAERLGLAEGLRARGIGGLADWDRVKCLHLHYAHHLARGSAIGRWLEERFSLEGCSLERVICAEF
jgi:hypothetical protein